MAVNVKDIIQEIRVDFLSCLRGSERSVKDGIISGNFLSCLRGSEHQSLTASSYTAVSKLPTWQ